MNRIAFLAVASAFVVVSVSPAAAAKCTADSVQVGPACVDTYEASVWSTTTPALVKKIQKGKISMALELLGAIQHGIGSDDYGVGCPDDAAGCKTYYAVSIPNTPPSAHITWFQAQAACRNAGKRLATNAEWQAAAYGTPDPGTDNGSTDCNIDNVGATVGTGTRSSCVSDVGAFDMVGNLYEWVADWADRMSTGCTDWTAQTGIPGGDDSCFGGNGSTAFYQVPGALVRGGSFTFGVNAGVFAVDTFSGPAEFGDNIGFRCAR